MKRNLFIFGAIMGAILVVNMIPMVYLCYQNSGMEANYVVGYASMVVAFSMTFFGIRNYRNKVLGGYISFGKAFKMGLLMALVGSTLYVVVWLFSYYLFVPDFIEVYSQHVLDMAAREGASAAELAEQQAEMAQFAEWYKNPAFVVLITYTEVLPVGLVVALVSALILMKRRRLNGVADVKGMS